MGIATGAQPDRSQRTWPPALGDVASPAPSPIVEAALSPENGGHEELPPIEVEQEVEQVE